MNSNKPCRFAVLFVTLFVALTICSVNATESQTVNVPPSRGVNVIILNLNQGERVTGSFSVIDGQVWFKMKDPNGNVVIDGTSVRDGSTFEHTADKTGAYTLAFENYSNRYERIVTVSYDVWGFGTVTGLFANPLILIESLIIVILLAIIAILVLRRKHMKN